MVNKNKNNINHDLEFIRLRIKRATQRMWDLRNFKKNGKDVTKDLRKTLKDLHEFRVKKKEILKLDPKTSK